LTESASAPKQDKDQSERFIETARELGCDEDEAAFDEKLRRIATAKTEAEDDQGWKAKSDCRPASGNPHR
jgi:hypothetical protein